MFKYFKKQWSNPPVLSKFTLIFIPNFLKTQKIAKNTGGLSHFFIFKIFFYVTRKITLFYSLFTGPDVNGEKRSPGAIFCRSRLPRRNYKKIQLFSRPKKRDFFSYPAWAETANLSLFPTFFLICPFHTGLNVHAKKKCSQISLNP